MSALSSKRLGNHIKLPMAVGSGFRALEALGLHTAPGVPSQTVARGTGQPAGPCWNQEFSVPTVSRLALGERRAGLAMHCTPSRDPVQSRKAFINIWIDWIL